MSQKPTLTEEFFEDLYSRNKDPWNFTASEYEAKKYTATLQSLPRNNYINALEIGCSIGVLTEKLAARCTRLLSVDVSEQALEQAKKRCKNEPHVSFRKMSVPQAFPDDKFDLILISEVGYFLAKDDWRIAMEKAFLHLTEQGQIALVHWLPPVHDFPQTGDEVHESFAQFTVGKMQNLHNVRNENYRIDIWGKY